MNNVNSRYLLYKDYESGLNNELMSVELAVGLAYLTQRTLVYYGSIGENKQLMHIRGGNFFFVPEKRKAIINNNHIPTILDILEELPVKTIDYQEFRQCVQTNKLTIHHSDVKLVNAVFVPDNFSIKNSSLIEFADGRNIFQDVKEDVLHISKCNLGYYSRFFYLATSSLHSTLEQVRPKQVYRDLASKIYKSLGRFNGIHVRLTDFRNFLPQEDKDYPNDILKTIRAILPKEELLVISTDESDNKDFFAEITAEYKNHLFLDNFIIKEFPSEFQMLPFIDETTLGLICSLVMSNAEIFVGTPGSSFSGIIQRNWLRNRLKPGKNLSQLDFKYINSGFEEGKVQFHNGSYIETKKGTYSWNRISLPIATETQSWYREWHESVILNDAARYSSNPNIQKNKLNIIAKNIKPQNIREREEEKISNKDIEILLCCAKTFLDIPHVEKLKNKLKTNINWNYLISLARQHGVMPLLYWNINQICPELVPKEILNELKENFYTNTSHNLNRTSELLQLLNLFKTHDISAIPFKGAVLAASVYGHLGFRQFGDLDILVRKQDFFKVKELLESEGYQTRRKVQRDNTKARVYVEFQSELEFVQKDRKTAVDLHCHISPIRFSGYPSIKHLWNSLETTSLAGTNVYNFLPEEQLILLCLHGSKEKWERLARIVDIATLLHTRKDINWERVLKNAKKWGSQRVLYLGLFLANKLLDIEIPEKVWQKMQTDLIAKSIANQLCKQFFLARYSKAKSFNRFLFHFRSRESLRGKLKYCFISTIYYTIRSWLKVNH